VEDLLPSVISARALSFLGSTSTKPVLLAPTALSYYGLEPLQLVKYAPSQYYHHHVDWFDALIRDDIPGKGVRGKGKGRLYNRVASFFIYLEDGCVGGGTEFPYLKLDDSTTFAGKRAATEESPAPAHAGSVARAEHGGPPGELEFWKERVEIERKDDKVSQRAQGTIFKPRKGSGVFWINLHESGFGDQRVRHAGLPVQEGQKVGMNIWVKRDFGW
jgi:prolyl 4-hydroxylase